jgi:hypothetical protein
MRTGLDIPIHAAEFSAEIIELEAKLLAHPHRDRALDHVAGYSLFNDATIRDFQLRTPQWTMGKNFDATGAIGPWLVTPDAVPPGAQGLRIQGRLNGRVMQESRTDLLIFSVPVLIEMISVAISLEPGDVIITGTPGGVGAVRKPPVFMQPGDVFEVEIKRVDILIDVRRHWYGAKVEDDGRRVRARPGMVLGHVNAMLGRYGRRVGPDPASSHACTIGGVIANNSGGMRCTVRNDA